MLKRLVAGASARRAPRRERDPCHCSRKVLFTSGCKAYHERQVEDASFDQTLDEKLILHAIGASRFFGVQIRVLPSHLQITL